MHVFEFFTPFRQSIDLGWVYPQLPSFNPDPQVVDISLVEQTFGQFQVEVLPGQHVQYVMDYSLVQLFIVPCGYEHIVHVDENAPGVPGLEGGEDSIHAPLEHGGSVGHTKEHALGFIMTIGSLECQFPAIFGFHLNVVVAVTDVEGGEDSFAMQLL